MTDRGSPLPGWPYYGEDEIESVVEILRHAKGNYWFGDHGAAFEREFADYCGVKYGLTVANGTLALDLALRSLEISNGNEVIVTPRSFIASANCVALCGARPIFADVDHDSQNVTAHSISNVLSEKTKAVIVVHLAGWPCDMPQIMDLAKRYNIYVIEDCAQAHGAAVGGKKVGSFGHVAAFSFCQDKIISTGGEGGMMLTGDEEIWARAASFRNHGKDPRKYTEDTAEGDFNYSHDMFGSNYRLTEMQSSIGRLQLKKLDQWINTRRYYAGILNESLTDIDIIRTTVPPPHIGHAYYQYYAFLRPEFLKKSWSRQRIIREINDRGFPCSTGICPEIYKEKAYRAFAPPRQLPIAAELGKTSIMLPVHPTLTVEHVKSMADTVRSVLKQANA